MFTPLLHWNSKGETVILWVTNVYSKIFCVYLMLKVMLEQLVKWNGERICVFVIVSWPERTVQVPAWAAVLPCTRELVVVVSCSGCWVTLHFLAAGTPLSIFTCCSLILLYSGLQNLCNTGKVKQHNACVLVVGLCYQHGRIVWRELHKCLLG